MTLHEPDRPWGSYPPGTRAYSVADGRPDSYWERGIEHDWAFVLVLKGVRTVMFKKCAEPGRGAAGKCVELRPLGGIEPIKADMILHVWGEPVVRLQRVGDLFRMQHREGPDLAWMEPLPDLIPESGLIDEMWKKYPRYNYKFDRGWGRQLDDDEWPLPKVRKHRPVDPVNLSGLSQEELEEFRDLTAKVRAYRAREWETKGGREPVQIPVPPELWGFVREGERVFETVGVRFIFKPVGEKKRWTKVKAVWVKDGKPVPSLALGFSPPYPQ